MVSENFKKAEYGIETNIIQPTFSLVCPSRAISYLSRQLANREESLKLGDFKQVTLGDRNPFSFSNIFSERKAEETWKAPLIYAYEEAFWPFGCPAEEIEDHKAGYVGGNEENTYEALKIGLRYELQLKKDKVLPISTIKLIQENVRWQNTPIAPERRDHIRLSLTDLEWPRWQRTDLSSILPTEYLLD
jgi:hypothetical protein